MLHIDINKINLLTSFYIYIYLRYILPFFFNIVTHREKTASQVVMKRRDRQTREKKRSNQVEKYQYEKTPESLVHSKPFDVLDKQMCYNDFMFHINTMFLVDIFLSVSQKRIFSQNCLSICFNFAP